MSTLEQDIATLAPEELLFLDAEQKWLETARDKQVLPIDNWNIAVARAGRGFGKTALAANWVRREAGLYPGIVIHAVAPSHADLIGTLYQGISGILAVTPPELVESTNFSAAIPTITFKNGSVVRGFSSQSPDRLRGPQCSRVVGDEVAAWENPEATLTNIDMSTRIAFRTASGKLIQPQKLFVSTPKPLKWLADLIKRAQIVISGSTYENKENLATDFLRDISLYEGTTIGRQEIHGELIDIAESAIIKKPWMRLWSAKHPLPWMEFIAISLDTALTERTYDRKKFEADPTACTVWGVFSYERKWNLMLLECWRDHLGFPELVKRAKKELKAEYGRRSEVLFKPLIGSPLHAEQVKRADLMIIEAKGSGISLRQMLSQEGVDTYGYNPGKADKLSRLHAVSHVAASGRIWLPESTKTPGVERNWITPLLDEVCVYSGPGTTPHDDYVDSCSQAWRYFADRWLNVGVEGIMAKDSVTVNTSLVDPDRLEWIAGEDRIPGYTPEDSMVDNPYG